MSKEEEQKSSGGLPFFFTLLSLAILSLSNLTTLPKLWDSTALKSLFHFLIGLTFGAWFAHTFIKGHLHVFIHEFKHKLFSGLVGNKSKALSINRKTGHYKYSYSKETEKFNAFISLAPYFTPLFTFFAVLAVAIIYYKTGFSPTALIGIALGADCALNWRDISPAQTDITNITGGYLIGLIFIYLANIFIITSILAWIFQRTYGLKTLIFALGNIFKNIYFYLI